jgi:hypothetical protein
MAGTGSPDGVRRVLVRLVAQGIVLGDEHPNATLPLLNRDHVAADAIVALTRLRTTMIEALSTWSPEPMHASLFGSFARGEATTASDIDILVVIAPAGAADQDARATQIDQLAADILRWTGNHGHIVDPTSDILAAMTAADDPLVASWRTDHIQDPQVAAALAVLAAIAATDAICGLQLGRYSRGQDHDKAAMLLGTVDLPDHTLPTKLRRVFASKDNVRSSPHLISETDAQALVRQARALVDAAERH